MPADLANDPLAALPGYALRRAATTQMAQLSVRMGTIGLRVTEASVLLLIGARPGLTSADIGKILDIQRANMAPLLARIEDAGLIVRAPIDRKSQAILLTRAGETRRAEVEAITNAFETELLARIPAEHRDHLLPALQALWD